MVSTGRPWDEFEDMAMSRINALSDYLRENPASHLLLRAFVGYKPPPPALSEALAAGAQPGRSAIESFFKRIPGPIPEITALPEMVMKANPDG